MKVLFLVNIPSPYRVAFFNELGKYCDLTVVFERYRSSERKESWHDYNFKHFDAVFLSGIKVGANKGLDLNIRTYLSHDKNDIIIVGNYSTPNGILSISYLSSKKIPFLISVDGGIIDYEESRFKYLLKKKLISSATGWLSTGKFTNKYLIHYGAQEEGTYIYPFTTMKENNIITKPLNEIEKKELRKELNIPYNNMILSVGQFVYGKGFDVLIEAAKDFKEDTGVYIIGGTPPKEYLNLINKFNIKNVHFLDFLEYKKLEKYYVAADIFVFPTRQDVWGLVINEAMANGLPVITTTSCVAGVEMINEGINGYLVPNDNINQIVEKTNYILENFEVKEMMSENNLLKAREYTIENMAETTYEILNEFVN